MFNYLAFLYGGLNTPGNSYAADGVALAEQCLQKLEATGNPEQFPPRLLILLTSPAYDDRAQLQQMLASIRQTFAGYKRRTRYLHSDESLDVPLLGSSTAAVIFDTRIHEQGALLVCLASRLIEAEAAASENVLTDHKAAALNLLTQLKLDFPDPGGFVQKPLTDRLLLTFFPALGALEYGDPYLAPELHRLLRQHAFTRIPIIGGVAASPGFQFANDDVLDEALVAARIFTGSPYTSSIGHGLTETDSYLRITDLADDRRTVHAFDQAGNPAELLKLTNDADFALLGELSLNRDPLINVARLAPNGRWVKMLREINQNDLFKLLERNPADMRARAAELFADSQQRQMIEKPLGCLALHCRARLDAGLDFAGMIEDAEQVMRNEIGIYLGGFFDGEAGVDETGCSLFSNWCVSTLCFSDEMRELTPPHTGFKAISDAALTLMSVSSLDDALEHSLKVIFDTGFSGAMISMVMQDKSDQWLVAKRAFGARFNEIIEITQRQVTEPDILSYAIRNRQPEFIQNSCADSRCDQDAISQSKIISQYVLPLFDREGDPIAVLQFDMGDLRRRSAGLYEAEQRILQALGAVVGAAILGEFNREEADIALKLDQALMGCMRANTRDAALQIFIRQAAEHFKVQGWHVRLPKHANENVLEMIAGAGDYYQVFQAIRQEIAADSDSPTALAFKNNCVVVINDSQRDDWQRKLLESYRNNLAAYDAYKNARSFANVPIRGDNGKPLGTISLISTERWFFTRSRVRTLDALSQRIGYLIEHFQRKEKEQEYRERKFLLEISSDFVRTADFTRPYQAITEAVERFCQAANAEIASLFIWDKETERLILRAQTGWAEPEWVDAARYQMGESWTGGVAEQLTPQYVPDMHAFKMEFQKRSGRGYTQRVLGHALSADYSVEAIGLPLRASENQPLGVLILLRKIDPKNRSQASGFTTINPAILQEAADTMSALLKALQDNLQRDWYQQEMNRHAAVRTALEQGDRHIPLERRLCKQMIESFHTIRADLYLADNQNGVLNTNPIASEYKPEGKNLRPSLALIMRAAHQKKLQELHHPLSNDQWNDLKSTKTEGLIERVCLPILHEERLIGVLDLHCRVERKKSPLLALHDPQQLTVLAAKIGLAYCQQKQLELNAAHQLALQTMSAMVFSSAHRLMNLVQTIRSQSMLIKLSASVDEQNELLMELVRIVSGATDSIKRPMDVARQIKEIKPQSHYLRELIIGALGEFDLKILSPQLETRLEIAERTTVLVDNDLIREAFRNIIHNAMKAMPDGGTLTISEAFCEDCRTVQATFTDTGVGMNEEQIQAALSGFVARQNSSGMGVHVSLLLVRAHNGDLRIESQEGIGTKVTVTLPVGRMEVAR